jgi:hypothetical protein
MICGDRCVEAAVVAVKCIGMHRAPEAITARPRSTDYATPTRREQPLLEKKLIKNSELGSSGDTCISGTREWIVDLLVFWRIVLCGNRAAHRLQKQTPR